MLDIKYANVDDANFVLKATREICKIEKQKPESDKKQIKLIKDAIKNKEIRIIYSENNPVGFIQFKFARKSPYGLDYGNYEKRFCWIEWMYVRKGFRGKGIGKALHEDVVSICKKKGIKEILLDVFQINSLARKFYEKEDFSQFIQILRERIS